VRSLQRHATAHRQGQRLAPEQEGTVRAHPTSQFSQRATPTRLDDKKDKVVEPSTTAIIVRFFGVLIQWLAIAASPLRAASNKTSHR
jgi:hypothetical protein